MKKILLALSLVSMLCACSTFKKIAEDPAGPDGIAFTQGVTFEVVDRDAEKAAAFIAHIDSVRDSIIALDSVRAGDLRVIMNDQLSAIDNPFARFLISSWSNRVLSGLVGVDGGGGLLTENELVDLQALYDAAYSVAILYVEK